MSMLRIRRALEKRLEALIPNVPIAWEGTISSPPSDGSGYIRAELLPATGDSPTVGSQTELVIENGIYQLTLSYPSGQGMKEITERADILRDWFPKGLTLTESGIDVVVERRASVTPALIENGDRLAIVLSIPYFSHVYY